MVNLELPTVSIVIPVYNQEKYIRECVESILCQDYEDLEVIVVDDGSTDATPKILNEFGERIRYVRQKNQGPAAALNNGLQLAQGTLVAWLGSDDVYLHGKIKYQVRQFQEDPSLALIYTDWIMLDANGRELKVVHSPCPPPEKFARVLLAGNFINGSTVLMRKECHEKVGYYDENLKASVDADMWFRLLAHDYKFGHIAKPLVKYRRHPANLSHKFRLMQRYRDLVHQKALEAFSSQGFFTNSIEYEQLSYAFVKQFSFQSASIAIKKAGEIANKFSFRQAFLWFLFKMLNNQLFISLIGLVIKIKYMRNRISKL